MNPITCCLAALMILIPALCPAGDDMAAQNAVLILADLSGSMREAIDAEKPGGAPGETEKQSLPKAEIEKRLILSMAADLAARGYPFGVLAVEYVAGREACYRTLLPIDRYAPDDARDAVSDRIDPDYPLFNRRTPLGDLLRQIEETLIAQRTGKTALVLFSYGRESFYDREEDEKASGEDKKDSDQDDPVRGPLAESRRLLEKHPEKAVLHAVYLDAPPEAGEKPDDRPEGEIRMTRMAEKGAGRFSDGLAWYRNPVLITEFVSRVVE